MEIPDKELVKLIREDRDYLGRAYKSCKNYSISFLRKLSHESQVSDQDLEDIYQDAVLVFYENVIKEDFILTSTIQTYLNSVCRNQLLNQFKKSSKTVNQEIILDYDPKITDTLEEINIENERRFEAIERALEIIKTAGGKCFELLTLYWYEKRSMAYLADYFNYSTEVNTRVQKSKCQRRLKKLAYNILKE